MTDETERKPDTVTFTFTTTVDYVVDLRTGLVQRDDNGELGGVTYIALFCEGEFAGEGYQQSEFEGEDWDVVNRAEQLMDAAFTAGTMKGGGDMPEPPEELADAWRRYQAGEDIPGYELRRLDEWRADAREDALGW